MRPLIPLGLVLLLLCVSILALVREHVQDAQPGSIENYYQPDDTRFGEQWGLRETQSNIYGNHDISATAGWDIYRGNPSVKVGIITQIWPAQDGLVAPSQILTAQRWGVSLGHMRTMTKG